MLPALLLEFNFLEVLYLVGKLSLPLAKHTLQHLALS